MGNWDITRGYEANDDLIVYVRFLQEFYLDGEFEAVVERLAIYMLLEVMAGYVLTGSRLYQVVQRVQDGFQRILVDLTSRVCLG